jgi:hypothetical protein
MPFSAVAPSRCLVVAGCALLAGGAQAQVYKCVDRNGHTTYQQSPCAGGQSGTQLELTEPVVAAPTARSSDKAEALWHAAARERRAVVGMPKPFVTQGLGTPSEIRAPRSGEVGSEVWVYAKAGQATRIGFQDNLVAWMRTDATAAASSAAAGATVDRETRVREALSVGKTCTAALQEAGAPDRDEPLIVGQGAGAGTRYVYVFDAANANAYAAFVCVNGRVTSVERYLPGR